MVTFTCLTCFYSKFLFILIKTSKPRFTTEQSYLCSPFQPPHDKTNKMSVRPAKTQINLGNRKTENITYSLIQPYDSVITRFHIKYLSFSKRNSMSETVLILFVSRKVYQSNRFLWKSRLEVGVDSRRRITHICELFDLFRACCYM